MLLVHACWWHGAEIEVVLERWEPPLAARMAMILLNFFLLEIETLVKCLSGKSQAGPPPLCLVAPVTEAEFRPSASSWEMEGNTPRNSYPARQVKLCKTHPLSLLKSLLLIPK